MKKILFTFLSVLLSITFYSQTPIEGGVVSGTWTLEGSPYLIEGLITVPDDHTLTIEAGVEVIWQGSYTFYILGQILALGTENDSILFTAADPETGFASIRFVETPEENDSSRFDHCIFRYGKVYGTDPDFCGGAIAVFNFSKVVVNHCLFEYNEAITPDPNSENEPSGGAIAMEGSNMVIKNCTFKENKANGGGAILCFGGSNPTILGNLFYGNIAYKYGGSIFCYLNSSPKIIDNIFRYNTAHMDGGAILLAENCNPDIEHNLIHHNTSLGLSGAIEVAYTCPKVNLINNTIAHNHAADSAGGILISDNCSVTFINCIIWGNTTDYGSCQVFFFGSTGTVEFYYSDIEGGQDGVCGYGTIEEWEECIDEDPEFVDYMNYYLSDDSEYCVDMGSPHPLYDDDDDPNNPGSAWWPSIGELRNDMGAYGGHLYRDVILGIMEPSNPNHINSLNLDLNCFPNPASRDVKVTYNLENALNVELKIVNMSGKTVKTLVNDRQIIGEYKIKGDVSDLPPGLYIVQFTSMYFSTSKKLMIIH